MVPWPLHRLVPFGADWRWEGTTRPIGRPRRPPFVGKTNGLYLPKVGSEPGVGLQDARSTRRPPPPLACWPGRLTFLFTIRGIAIDCDRHDAKNASVFSEVGVRDSRRRGQGFPGEERGQSCASHPRRRAYWTTSTRLFSPSFSIERSLWVSTVLTLISSWAAISLLLNP